MPPREIPREMLTAGPKSSGWRMVMGVCLILAGIGAATFLKGALGMEPLRAWQAYHINFVFWTGLAFGGILFSAVLTIVNAHWGRSMKRLAESIGAFLPVAFVLFCLLYLGKDEVFPWIDHPVPQKASWLNAPFLFTRDGISMLVLIGLAFALIALSVREDLRALSGAPPDEAATRKIKSQALSLSVVYTISYSLILSLLAFDLIMSLDPEWTSSLFGAYYFTGSFYTGLAMVFVLSIAAQKTMGFGRFFAPEQFHDLGMLLLGFCLMTGDFFYTQFLVIWYGNLPDETGFVVRRTMMAPWSSLAWIVLAVCFIIPFVLLLSRRLKRKLFPMLALCLMILADMWIERLLLIAPSLWKRGWIPIGWMEVLITAGFFGLFALCVLLFLRRFPALPIADPLLYKQLHKQGKEVA